MTARRALSSLVLLGLSALGQRAHAGAGEQVGLSPRDMALAGSMAATPSSYAAYWNPAAIEPGEAGGADGSDYALALSFIYAHPVLYAERIAGGGSLALATEPVDTVGVSLGSRLEIGKPIGLPGLGLGVVIYLPTEHVFRWSIHPDDKPQWLLWSDATQVIDIDLGLAYRATSWLSLGVGLRVLFDAETFTTGRVTDVEIGTDPETGASDLSVGTQLGEDVRVFGRVAPLAGVLVTPVEELRIGVVYRGQIYVDDWGWTRIQGVPGSGDLGYVHHYAHYFHPHTLEAGVSVRPLEPLTVSVDVTWRHHEEALTTNQQALGPGRFGDTVAPALAGSWQLAEPLRLLAGYRFEPSPFDNLAGPTNLLDGDRHTGSLGGELDLGILPGSDIDFRLGWAGQVAFLSEREEAKDPRRFASDLQFLRNPGREPYRYGGVVPALSLGLDASW